LDFSIPFHEQQLFVTFEGSDKCRRIFGFQDLLFAEDGDELVFDTVAHLLEADEHEEEDAAQQGNSNLKQMKYVN